MHVCTNVCIWLDQLNEYFFNDQQCFLSIRLFLFLHNCLYELLIEISEICIGPNCIAESSDVFSAIRSGLPTAGREAIRSVLKT